MTEELLLREIRLLVERERVGSATRARRLEELANRPGAAELLARIVRSSDLTSARLAALALPYARSELVRRGLRREAGRTRGERRAAILSALTDEEVEVLAERHPEGLVDDLLSAAGRLAANDPRAFVQMVCDAVPEVGTAQIAHFEQVRSAYRIPAASLYAPVLERRLSGAARREVYAILGRQPEPEVQALLERQLARVRSDEERRLVRRERMRQASRALEPVKPPPETHARLSPVGTGGGMALEVYEPVAAGRVLRSTVMLPLRAPATAVSVPLDGPLERALQPTQAATEWASLSVGQARALLEALPARRRGPLVPVLDRLRCHAPEPLTPPGPGELLTLETARALVRERPWRDWRPFSALVEWPDGALSMPARVDAFPGGVQAGARLASTRLPDLLAERGVGASVAAGLRHMATWLHLRGDPRAGAVAAESVWAAKRRPAALTRALLERELWLQRWALMRLPAGYRGALREALRAMLAPPGTEWPDVQRLDLAQAAAEGLVRAHGESATTPGLPPVDALDLALAMRLADRARALLQDPSWRRLARAQRLAALLDAARQWVDEAPATVAFELARFAVSVCFDRCPHRCFEQSPGAAPEQVFRGDRPD